MGSAFNHKTRSPSQRQTCLADHLKAERATDVSKQENSRQHHNICAMVESLTSFRDPDFLKTMTKCSFLATEYAIPHVMRRRRKKTEASRIGCQTLTLG